MMCGLHCNGRGIAYVQNGRNVLWSQVATEDLIATVGRYPGTVDAEQSKRELAFRCDGPCACSSKAADARRDGFLVCVYCHRKVY